MVKEVLSETKNRMEKTLESTQAELGKVRTGRANLSLLDTIKVDYYGSMVSLKQVANLGVPEPRLITIQPWERNLLGEIEKDFIRLIHQLGEEGRIAVRNIRRDTIDQLRKAQKEHTISEDEEYNGGIDAQELTDEYIKKIDAVIKSKEDEIMEV
jgi:ribosome recycling factor